LCQRLLVLVAVTGGGVIAVLAGVLAVALVAVSLALARCLEGRLVMQIYTVIRQCRYIQS
jgi:hypothetical protein